MRLWCSQDDGTGEPWPGKWATFARRPDHPHNQAVAHRHRPLILAYHAVDSAWASPLAISTQSLAAQAATLNKKGYRGLTVSDAERRRDDGSLPERCVVFTFDDGYVSTRRAAAILAEFGYPGTVFVVSRYADEVVPFAWFGVEHEDPAHMVPLGWDDLRELTDQGWEVGSHTVTHPLLTAVDDATLEHELTWSRARIIDRLGSCESLAYPYGQADPRVAAAAAQAGYRTAVMLTGVELADEPMRRPRLGLGSADLGLRLRLKLSAPSLAARRSAPARLIRGLRPGRSWLPSHDVDGAGA
jgi:peptidoglycan/xylan/chitin deacetylase (PgdA/CDA1 family)